jgi:hypothetical protein
VSLFSLVLELNMLIALFGAGAALLRGGDVAGRRTFTLLSLTGAIWCAGGLLEDRHAVDAWVGLRLSMLGLVLVGPLWIGLAAHMAQWPVARRIPWFPAALSLPGLLLWLLLFVEPWSSAVMPEPGRPGPLWWAFTPFAYAMILAGSVLHIGSGSRRRDSRGFQTIAIGFAGLLPLVAHASWTWLGFPEGRDPTPLLLTPVGLALAATLFPGGLFDVRPLAQRELIDHLPLGVVMADRSGTVFAVNVHAEMALALPRAQAIGRALDAIVADAPESYRVEQSEVLMASQVVARFAFLHPPPGQTLRHDEAA